MREYISAHGERRFWFEEDEIERLMENELYEASMLPDNTHPSLDIESFLEVHLRVKLDLYADLENDVLGETKFMKQGRHLVQVHRGLTTEVEEADMRSSQLGRWRATLAHEAAHVILHAKLFEMPSQQGSLFDIQSDPSPALLRCLKRNVSFSRVSSDWREVQANRGMAGLLMPNTHFSRLVRTAVGATITDDLLEKMPVQGSTAFDSLIKEVSSLCEVSRAAACIRLETLGLVRGQDQLLLSSHLQLPSSYSSLTSIQKEVD